MTELLPQPGYDAAGIWLSILQGLYYISAFHFGLVLVSFHITKLKFLGMKLPLI